VRRALLLLHGLTGEGSHRDPVVADAFARDWRIERTLVG
jgi:hypothetical protein